MKEKPNWLVLAILLVATIVLPQQHARAQESSLENATVGVSGGIGFGYADDHILTKRPPKSLFLTIHAPGDQFVFSAGMSGYHFYQYKRDSFPEDVVLGSFDFMMGWNNPNRNGLFGGSGIGILVGYGIKNNLTGTVPLMPWRIGTYVDVNCNIVPFQDFWGGTNVLSVFTRMTGSGLFFSKRRAGAPILLGEMEFGLAVTASGSWGK
jgi:hypothetical protein